MEETIKQTNKKLNRFNKLYPWFEAISGDLMFYIAIDTLFLTIVKGLDPAQIAMLTTISAIISILMQLPLLKLIKKIGNTKSVRLGALLLLMSACFITFSPSFIGIVFGRILYELSFIFRRMGAIALKNNLIYQKRAEDYLKMSNKGNILYAAITLVIALIAGPIFNVDNYLPMYFCIGFAALGFILSFEVFDISETHKLDKQEEEQEKNKKVKLSKIVILILISYTLVYGLIVNGQGNSKLLIQYDLSQNFEVTAVAIYLSIIVAISRLSRLVANLLFEKIYSKFLKNFHVFISWMLILAFVLVMFGHFIVAPLILKFVIMTIGFCIILMVRDPFRIFMQDLILARSKFDEQQTLFTYMELGRKLGTASISILITAVLTKLTLIYVIGLLLALAIAQLFIARKLYKVIK